MRFFKRNKNKNKNKQQNEQQNEQQLPPLQLTGNQGPRVANDASSGNNAIYGSVNVVKPESNDYGFMPTGNNYGSVPQNPYGSVPQNPYGSVPQGGAPNSNSYGSIPLGNKRPGPGYGSTATATATATPIYLTSGLAEALNNEENDYNMEICQTSEDYESHSLPSNSTRQGKPLPTTTAGWRKSTGSGNTIYGSMPSSCKDNTASSFEKENQNTTNSDTKPKL